LHSNVRDSSPSLLKDGVQLHQNTVAVDAQHAKVVMKATGSTIPVEFSIRRADDPDRRMELLGNVVDSGRGQVFCWIAKLNEVGNSGQKRGHPLAGLKSRLMGGPFSVGASFWFQIRRRE
jgi:hypothetical protein